MIPRKLDLDGNIVLYSVQFNIGIADVIYCVKWSNGDDGSYCIMIYKWINDLTEIEILKGPFYFHHKPDLDFSIRLIIKELKLSF